MGGWFDISWNEFPCYDVVVKIVSVYKYMCVYRAPKYNVSLVHVPLEFGFDSWSAITSLDIMNLSTYFQKTSELN